VDDEGARVIAVRIALAIVFIALGIAGLLLPILPGWLFFLAAFAVLAPQHRWTKAGVEKIERRGPKLAKFLRQMGIG
jgi:uncharacterized membrane protein YbaN (DUF454 family)